MSKPTMQQIAESRELWMEYVDPQNNDPELFDTTTVGQRVNIQREIWPDEVDDDPAPMPTLDVALARIAAENPKAATIARSLLDGKGDTLTMYIRARVTPVEKARISAALEAHGMSESDFIRACVFSMLDVWEKESEA